MSYSRWSNSRWYTYWLAVDEENLDEAYSLTKQKLDIYSLATFTYKELTEDLDKCVDTAVRKEEKRTRKVTEEEKKELRGYMLRFIEDVESDKDVYEYTAVKSAPLEDLPLLVGLKGPAGELLSERLKTEG